MAPTFTRILVPMDFGAESTAAFRTAVSLARSVGASIYLLHVARDPFLAVSTPELYGIDWDALRDDIAKEAKARLSTLADIAGDVPIMCDVRVGRVADTIVHVAEETRTGLIVMGTHGRSTLGHLLLGSVAERVIRLAPCPVMTVRDSGAVQIASSAAAAAEPQAVGHVLL